MKVLRSYKALPPLISTWVFISLCAPFASAKIKPASPFKPKELEIGFIKGIRGSATLEIQQTLQVPSEDGTLKFQNGKLAEDIEYYRSPRCYLHFKKDAAQQKEIAAGQKLKVSKIDNSYSKGSVHVTFWFDEDPNVSDLSCVTNYKHTLTVDELKSTLGNTVVVSIEKSVETGALFNTAPVSHKDAKILSEDTEANNHPIQSARIILQGT